MSNKTNLKDKIKKPTPTQVFLQAYDENTSNNERNKITHEDIDNNITKEVDMDIHKVVNKNIDIYKDTENKIIPKIVNVDSHETVDEVESYGTLDSILSKEKKKNVKVTLGVYVDPEVANVLDDLAKKNGYGTKSNVVNDILKATFKKKGLLK